MIGERPLQGFQITKKKWWADLIAFDAIDNTQEREEYSKTITGDECLQAMKQTLKK
jgi:hypothetical protein